MPQKVAKNHEKVYFLTKNGISHSLCLTNFLLIFRSPPSINLFGGVQF